MTTKENLNNVHEPEQQGHIHAELMAQYAEDAKTHSAPWKLWQYERGIGVWCDLETHPKWHSEWVYRRKPKTRVIHGVEIPDLRATPKHGEDYYLASPTSSILVSLQIYDGDTMDKLWIERGLAYQHNEEGKQAAILHAQVMLGYTHK